MQTIYSFITLLSFGFIFPLHAQQDPDPLRFAQQIQEFDSLDAVHPPKKNGTVFIGSSSVRMWTEAEKKYKKYKVINRGFGGSQASDANYYFDQLVAKYEPAKIVYYEGDNDVAAGKLPETILEDFQEFVGMVESNFPETKVGFISIKPSPSRWHLLEQLQKANALIKEYCEQKENLTYIDVFTPMLGDDGRPIPSLYRQDSLHMMPKGYLIWNKQVEPFLKDEL